MSAVFADRTKASTEEREDIPTDVFSVFRDDDGDRNVSETNNEAPRRNEIEKFAFGDLLTAYPKLHDPVVDGLFRSEEVVNIVASPKVGKSWLAYSLGLSIIKGGQWLDTFDCARGDVCLIDAELHRPTLSYRIPCVGKSLGMQPHEYARHLEVWPLRGRLRGLAEIVQEFDHIERGRFKAIVLDAKYRFATAGQSENDNAAETLVYNLLDELAEKSGAAVILIHHSSKGDQSGKRVSDVGSGAGAQSRAADVHLVLREHDEPGHVVLAADIRNFKPAPPLALRWTFPLWVPAHDVDPEMLKGRKTAGEEKSAKRDRDGCDSILKALRAGPASPRDLRGRSGLSRGRIERLLDILESAGQVTFEEVTKRGNQTRVYQLADVGD